jgi:hypothetical protein
MTLTGNQPQTQLDNIQEVRVPKDADAVLYGGVSASQRGGSTPSPAARNVLCTVF